MSQRQQQQQQQTSPPKGVETRFDKNGKPNPTYVDLLEEDKPIAGQKFACISFVSPEQILKQKEHYMFEHFLKDWDFRKSMEKYTQFLNFVSYKYSLDFDKLTQDLQDFVKDQQKELTQSNIEDEYKNFLDANEERLEKDFNNLHNFQTTTRGIKVRGCFPTQQEAELRCKMLRELDPNHDVYVGPVGMWMPWHPEAYKTGRVEYLEDELNQLMKEKKVNENKAKEEFDKRVKEAKRKAIEDNIKKAQESGNMLTQTLNKEGELVSVQNTNTQEMALGLNGGDNDNGTTEVSTADIRKELFEGDNIVTGKTDHGLSEVVNKNNNGDNDDESKE